MPDKGWLKIVLEEARKDVNSRPDWQRNRVIAAEDPTKHPVTEPPAVQKPTEK